MIRIDAMWLAAEPIDMRAGAERLLARVVQVFGAAQAHHGYLFRLYSLAIAAAEASGCRHASRTSALNRALCLQRVARLTAPSIASTSFIADTMPAGSQAIKMTSPRAY